MTGPVRRGGHSSPRSTVDRRGTTDGGTRWATLPNAVTIGRLLLTVPLCWYLTADGSSSRAPVAVLVIAVVWAGSDWLDGALARRLGQRTRVGEILDPVADRLGILAICLCLAAAGQLPWWTVAAIAVTDVGVALLAGPSARRGRVSVSVLGKLRTAVLLCGLCLVLAGVLLLLPVADLGRAVLVAGTVLHVVAGADYVRRARVAR
ncbi:CDP-alcohol phosphatidyltransferase family protein [Georgenia sp. H159]|uniref:CDP-alcohol phosphatidyltransferase family protein n=1 Tax=Georgenia sp. H159 TaxID=3076115 RepID=UPI002D7A3495|nr:CDP-alcohol phosphatidyltransferase family protein [Georgenia sp. H159]